MMSILFYFLPFMSRLPIHPDDGLDVRNPFCLVFIAFAFSGSVDHPAIMLRIFHRA